MKAIPMKLITSVFLTSLGLGTAAFLLAPASEAYSFTGVSLNTNLRDFRVFNNFTDPGANNNNTPDANFPGAQGAAQALWKAYIEWGSRLHGNGNGDPHQPAGLGSGGANFDVTWQGAALSVGNITDNVVSELAGSSGGVLAYTEWPGSGGGWRMRFYSGWNWDDGPGTALPGSTFDLQGVGTHEFGHALGLGHTTAAGSTMLDTVVGNGVTQRSIAADDIAGVQARYGVASSTKPVITNAAMGPCSLTITGSNFSLTSNEVWFTRAGFGLTHAPERLTNVPSNGTTITVTAPVLAGPGDVLVKIPGTAASTLSNAWPVNPVTALPTSYCSTSPNSYDPFGAFIGYAGSTSISSNNFTLITTSVPPSTNGIYYYGHNQTSSTFGNGTRCIGSPVFRLPITQANSFAETVYQINFLTPPPGGAITAGSNWNFQLWYRNPAGGGAGFNLSDGLNVTFCP